MSKIAETISQTGTGGRRSIDDLDPDKVKARVAKARLHLSKLSEISLKVDADDYTAIRDKLMPFIEAFQHAYSKTPSQHTKDKDKEKASAAA